ncbi:MAG: phosphate signaling complex protein PhoU [Veillonellaceae bacterium]|uniref:phosphate signaling complex protein PhoU n=1 Tax=Anaerovibrio lipolyticus TaxID=82374 RepID=UPI001F411B48|nr:phosphate signaling complex protein PhoU [Anaerovibrio lipolyticus]MCF2601877.1 phosphate signaling complex protein PhoU [Anaerovibrio lipolyticus]MCI7077868.1 phosphate signaling complex protein PhoU [Veillonellaceae bacterium]
MRSMFDQQLKTLNEEMLYMGGLCEDTIQQTIEALMSGDVKKAHALNNMMSQLTQQERSIENICLKLLMQQQPVARDLRTISSSLKMVTDMERIGIQACEIAEIIAAGNVVRATDKVDFQELSNEVSHMVQMAMMAYDKKDMNLADEVIKYDDVVDKLFCDIREDLIKQLKDDTNDAECFIDMLMIDKYFERIGDHAVNIASWVKFSITGEIQIVE